MREGHKSPYAICCRHAHEARYGGRCTIVVASIVQIKAGKGNWRLNAFATLPGFLRGVSPSMQSTAAVQSHRFLRTQAYARFLLQPFWLSRCAAAVAASCSSQLSLEPAITGPRSTPKSNAFDARGVRHSPASMACAQCVSQSVTAVFGLFATKRRPNISVWTVCHARNALQLWNVLQD